MLKLRVKIIIIILDFCTSAKIITWKNNREQNTDKKLILQK